ncbi:hypothetical protein E4U53_007543 [Claviceps sorghi]|nr:hypothetical protein E4U53_007543 [Claviceps sorghi]
MTERTFTLRHLLTLPKPSLTSGKDSRKPSSGPWPEIEDNLSIWEDFDLKNLNESYGHILDLPTGTSELPDAGQVLAGVTGVVIDSPKDVRLLIAWNSGIMERTLPFTLSRLSSKSGPVPCQLVSTFERLNKTKFPCGTMMNADHLILLKYRNQMLVPDSTTSLVAGLCKPCAMFDVTELANVKRGPARLVWPLRQLANLCKLANTRYGYIQTEQELVACCFSPQNDTKWKLAFKTVSWIASGDQDLTTDLALWWLCVLALSEKVGASSSRPSECDKDFWNVILLEQQERPRNRCKQLVGGENVHVQSISAPFAPFAPVHTARRAQSLRSSE